MDSIIHTSRSTPFDNMSAESQFLKMEDLHNPTSTSPAASPADSAAWPQSSPPPVIVTSKPAKKRKSWGQELPEPKTALPPRKRAKTDDEKEQRRIERIKRNRAAAHNSRERKRQETEDLAVKLARANAELAAYKSLHGELPAHIILPEIKVELEDPGATSIATPVPSLVESHGSQHDDAPSPASPADEIPLHVIKVEPQDTPVQFTLPAFDSMDSKSSVLMPLDLTQHSAAMLCDDLQCRSSRMSNTLTSKVCWWTNIILYLMTFQLQTCYKTLMVAMWTLSPSQMVRMMQTSQLRFSRSTNSSMTTRTLRSTPRRLARFNTATGQSAPLQQQSSDDESQKSRDGQAPSRHAHAHQKGQALRDRGSDVDLAMGGDEGYESTGVED